MPSPRRTRVRAYCPNHPSEVVAEWLTFDGTAVLLKGQVRQEYVGGWVPTSEELARVVEQSGGVIGRGNVSESPATEGDQPHWRLHIRCPRPSCSYRALFRGPRVEPVKELVRSLWRAGVDVYDLEGGDVDSFLRALGRRAEK